MASTQAIDAIPTDRREADLEALSRFEPIHHAIVAMDIEGFGRPDWSDLVRVHLRGVLYGLLERGLAVAGITGEQVEMRNDLGDGVLLLVRTEVSTARLLNPLVSELVAGLAEVNEDGTWPLRLRMVVHTGEVLRDPHGHTSAALIHGFRLLDAQEIRAALRRAAGADLVLAVSEPVWDGVVRHGYAGIDPAAYRPVEVRSKETRARAWVCIPGGSSSPAPPAAPATGPGDPGSDGGRYHDGGRHDAGTPLRHVGGWLRRRGAAFTHRLGRLPVRFPWSQDAPSAGSPTPQPASSPIPGGEDAEPPVLADSPHALVA